jgi:hypothetical protein
MSLGLNLIVPEAETAESTVLVAITCTVDSAFSVAGAV